MPSARRKPRRAARRHRHNGIHGWVAGRLPAGAFGPCLKSQETTPLETDLLEYKFYAPGVGNVLTIDANTGDRVELIQVTTN